MDNSAETITLNNLWEVIASHQGETFYTKKMLPLFEMGKNRNYGITTQQVCAFTALTVRKFPREKQ